MEIRRERKLVECVGTCRCMDEREPVVILRWENRPFMRQTEANGERRKSRNEEESSRKEKRRKGEVKLRVPKNSSCVRLKWEVGSYSIFIFLLYVSAFVLLPVYFLIRHLFSSFIVLTYLAAYFVIRFISTTKSILQSARIKVTSAFFLNFELIYCLEHFQLPSHLSLSSSFSTLCLISFDPHSQFLRSFFEPW